MSTLNRQRHQGSVREGDKEFVTVKKCCFDVYGAPFLEIGGASNKMLLHKFHDPVEGEVHS